jgi:hypothetical protein
MGLCLTDLSGGSKMISIVTTTVSTIVTSSSTSLLAALGIAGMLTLLASLAIKELASSGGEDLVFFGRNLIVVILPLVFVFSFLVFINVWGILS